MRFFRNPEIKRFVAVFIILSAAGIAVGCFLGVQAAILTAALCILFSLTALLYTRKRYRRLQQLCDRIDRVLHGGYSTELGRQEEGELAVLQSEIHKLTLTLGRQTDALQKDKGFLADALADISHQLRTPLTSMNLIAALLQNSELAPKRRSELARELSMLLERMDWLLSALLKTAQMDAGTVRFKKDRVEVSALLRRAAEPLAIAMELRGQQMRLSPQTSGDDNAAYIGDLAWSVEAVGNILKNCMEHTPENGWIEAHYAENPLYTELIIRDSGSGIAPEDLPHLFERFYKGRGGSATGFGIGLALARMIITRQNGTIKAENSREGGACFIIRFYKSAV